MATVLHPPSSRFSMGKPVYSSHDRLTKSTEPLGRAVQAIVGIVSITSRSRCSVRRYASTASLFFVISPSPFATRSIRSIGPGILPVGSVFIEPFFRKLHNGHHDGTHWILRKHSSGGPHQFE